MAHMPQKYVTGGKQDDRRHKAAWSSLPYIQHYLH